MKTPLIWTLWYLNRQFREEFIGSFFSEEEAYQHAKEMFPKRSADRFHADGFPAHLLGQFRLCPQQK